MSDLTMNRLIEDFKRLIATAMDEEGVFPHQAIIDENGKRAFLSIAKPNPINDFIRSIKASGDGFEYAIIGIDSLSKPGQGLTKDFLQVFIAAKGEKARFGAIEYTYIEDADSNTVGDFRENVPADIACHYADILHTITEASA